MINRAKFDACTPSNIEELKRTSMRADRTLPYTLQTIQ